MLGWVGGLTFFKDVGEVGGGDDGEAVGDGGGAVVAVVVDEDAVA